jgi:crossover junction endodeoxyribonuclease RusA
MMTITFPQPAELLNMNDRLHWAKKARIVNAWRTATKWGTHAARGAQQFHGLPPSTVTITLPVKGNRRRDPANYYATVKPIVDGLVDAGLWPDDTPEWVTTTEPVLDPTAAEVTVTVTLRDIEVAA